MNEQLRQELPKYNAFHWPTVEALRALGGSGSVDEVNSEVSVRMGFSEEIQGLLHGDGPETEVAYRCAWARTYLKGMGLAVNTARGLWTLTSQGHKVTEGEIPELRNKYLKEMREARAKKRGNDEVDDEDGEATWQDKLLEALIAMTPDAFERLCQRLLRESGFKKTVVTGRSGDGGLDGSGVYRVSLVSFQVFFQAKKWRNSVGAKEVRDFRGAMTGRGEKGLLITTSSFTADAKAEASRDGAPPVDLVDGPMLCELLVKHGIGVRVTPRTVLDVEVDLKALAEI
jgi:restriction system protein